MSAPAGPELLALVGWIACVGAVSAEAVALRSGCSPASARARLQHGERIGVLARWRPLRARQSLFTATRMGIRAAGAPRLDAVRVSAAGAEHALACATVAVHLERIYADRVLGGVPELRRREREAGGPLASAALPCAGHGPALMHRPDFVLWSEPGRDERPIVVEVELSVKSPLRLSKICRGWARCPLVGGVLYVSSPRVCAPLRRSIDDAGANGRIVSIGLGELEQLSAAVRRTV